MEKTEFCALTEPMDITDAATSLRGIVDAAVWVAMDRQALEEFTEWSAAAVLALSEAGRRLVLGAASHLWVEELGNGTEAVPQNTPRMQLLSIIAAHARKSAEKASKQSS